MCDCARMRIRMGAGVLRWMQARLRKRRRVLTWGRMWRLVWISGIWTWPRELGGLVDQLVHFAAQIWHLHEGMASCWVHAVAPSMQRHTVCSSK